MKDIAEIYSLWSNAPEKRDSGVLITVVGVSGSHYRHPGARMLILGENLSAGSVSAGCLEAVLRRQSEAIIRENRPVLGRYNTTPDENQPLIAGMGCGGIVDILIEPTQTGPVTRFMSTLGRCLETREPAAVATVCRISGSSTADVGTRIILCADGSVDTGGCDPTIVDAARTDLREAFSARVPVTKQYQIPSGQAELFIERIQPPVSLVLFGAGDDAIPVSQFARLLGWQVAIADHRTEYLTAARFGDKTSLYTIDPPHMTESLPLDSYDAAIVMTHSDMRDFSILEQILPTKLKYIGLLGASKRAERLLAKALQSHPELKSEQLARLYAPVGLDIGAEGPEEIALSIISEIQMVLHDSTARHLQDKRKLKPANTE